VLKRRLPTHTGKAHEWPLAAWRNRSIGNCSGRANLVIDSFPFLEWRIYALFIEIHIHTRDPSSSSSGLAVAAGAACT
jgi:hypothetical protein